MSYSKRQMKKIREYYANQTISERIKNITPKGSDKGDTYVNAVYENYHITQYSNKAEYESAVEFQTRAIVVKQHQAELKKMRRQQKDVKPLIEKLTQDKIDQGWKDYQHRDDLIRTGQYDEFRIQDYKDKYVSAMKEWGIDEKYIEAIENAETNKLRNLFSQPEVEKDNRSKYKLPVLGFYYGTLKSAQRAEVTNAISDALSMANIDIDSITIDTPLPEVHKMYKARTYNITASERSAARSAYRHLRVADRPTEYDYDSLYNNMINAYENNTLNIKTTKRGYKYIPFVGSTNPKSKNAKFMREFVDYANAVGVKLDK